VRVDAVDVEAREPHPRQFDAGAENAHAVDRRESVDQTCTESRLVRGDARHAHGGQVVDRRGEGDHLRHPLGASLEALRGRQVFRLGGGDRRDHRSAGEEGRHGLEQRPPSVEGTDARRSEHLVPRQHREVDVERPHIQRQVGRRLARVEHDESADAVRHGDELLDGIDDPEHVRDVRERDEPSALADEFGGDVEPQRAVIVEGDHPQGRPGPCREFLPRDQVGVVLHLGGDDLIALVQAQPLGRRSPATQRRVRDRVGDEVDRLRGVRGPDDLALVRADEAGDGGTRIFEDLGRLGGERVRAAVHCGIEGCGELAFSIEHGERSLRRRARIEVDERMPVHDRLEDREVLAQTPHLGVRQRAVARRGDDVCFTGSAHPSSFSSGAPSRVTVDRVHRAHGMTTMCSSSAGPTAPVAGST
jgi:hypothetical protein